MKNMIKLAATIAIAVSAVGCEQKTQTVKKVEVTQDGPGGDRKATVEQKVETTDDTQTKTTTEKVETKP